MQSAPPPFGYLNNIFTLGKQPRTPLTELAIHSKFVEFLCAVAQACPRNTYVPQEFDDSITHKIYSITSYIHSNYAQELSLDYISKNFSSARTTCPTSSKASRASRSSITSR